MWPWPGRPKRDIPSVNYTEGDSEGEDFDSPLTSPKAPVHTRQGSPARLAVPTLCDNVDEVLYDVSERLVEQLENSSREEVIEVNLKVASDDQELAAPNNMAPAAVDFDLENENDGEKAQDLARSIKMEFEPNDIKFWFAQIEDEMTLASVKSQWLKKTVLQRNLPNKQKEDVKAYLTIPKSEAGNIYKTIKTELIRIYSPKPQDSYKKALSRTMTGLPSQLGYQIINDICKKQNKLQGCCCPAAALAIWDMKLPVNIRAHISQKEFTPDTYKAVFEAADQVYMSSSQVSVAAVSAPQQLDETLPAFTSQNQPQVAAVQRGNRSNRGGRNKPQPPNSSSSSGTSTGGRNRNSNQAQGGTKAQSSQARGPRHASMPPESCCSRHYRHGADAWYCLAPLTCPWVNKCAARPT